MSPQELIDQALTHIQSAKLLAKLNEPQCREVLLKFAVKQLEFKPDTDPERVACYLTCLWIGLIE